MIRAWLAVAGLASCAWGGDEFLALMRKAEARKEPAERNEYFTRALDAWTPVHSRSLRTNCLFRRGEARYALRRFPDALADLGAALQEDPRNARAYLLRGRIRLHEARARQSEAQPGAVPADPAARTAAQDLASYAALLPDDPEGWLALGAAQALAGRSDEALSSLRRARELAPEDFRTRLGEATVHMLFRRWDAALDALNESARLSKGRDGETLIRRGLCRLARRERDAPGARRDLDEGLRLEEEALAGLLRAGAPPEDVARREDIAGLGCWARGRLREEASDAAGALADYDAGCGHGHRHCCRRASQLRRDPPAAKPAPRKRRKVPNPVSDPGDRIYGG